MHRCAGVLHLCSCVSERWGMTKKGDKCVICLFELEFFSDPCRSNYPTSANWPVEGTPSTRWRLYFASKALLCFAVRLSQSLNMSSSIVPHIQSIEAGSQ
ncbi:hypothetical protein GOODEAATRI_011219 [Goodea atripinnis]|uniref:Secreted protein n=1 Tax=Goodea atripinnis TaxID=208336 RepID=A0ABV0NKA5_9TELE